MKRLVVLLGAVAVFVLCAASSRAQTGSNPALAAILEPIRLKYQLPALAGAIFTRDGVVAMAAVGVRKAETDIPVTTNDLWHLGSDTKAMTRTTADGYGPPSFDSEELSRKARACSRNGPLMYPWPASGRSKSST